MIPSNRLTETRASRTSADAPAILHRALLPITLVLGFAVLQVHPAAAQATGVGESSEPSRASTTAAQTPAEENASIDVGEITPRVAEEAPDQLEYGFGLEKRVGKHAFSLTVTNSFGLTFAQLARGGTANSLYLGFNIGRKFF